MAGVTAMQKEDMERIVYLLGYMPTADSFTHIDQKTKRTMQALCDYVCHELKDEALACQLVALGYDMNRVDVSKAGFGQDFAEALMADLEHAVTHVLKLNHGKIRTVQALGAGRPERSQAALPVGGEPLPANFPARPDEPAG